MDQSSLNRNAPELSVTATRFRNFSLISGVSYLALSASLAFAPSLNNAFAAGATPSGGQFAAGAGAIAPTANGLSITQSTSRGIIDWQSFSIGQGNAVNIANGSGATLNRVTGGDISNIAGSLTSTGSVYVINPAGIVVMPSGQVVTTGSFVASTRDVSNSSFMAGGAQNFKGTSTGTVVNQGSITSANGDVILIGQSVTNSGQISAPNGTVGLAAGDDILLQPSSDPEIVINAGTGDATNSGNIAAAQAELAAAGGNVYALATNNGGVIRATGSATKDGHVYLTAGGNVTVAGTVSATNADGSGGTVKAIAGSAGGILSVTGAVNVSAIAASAKGGVATLTGNTVNIGSTAIISANGGTDSGNIFIGGDRHGGTDPSVALSASPIPNAQYTTVSAGANIAANGGWVAGTLLGGAGNGGNVVVWSNISTNYAGAISAQGGQSGGNGGFVEVSGEKTLSFTGAVNTLAPLGTAGTLLLDPSDVTIVSSTDSNGTTTTTNESAGTPYNPTASTSYILNTDLDAALQSGNVVINTGTVGDGFTNNGNIHFGTSAGPTQGTNAAPLYWTSNSSLTLNATGYIDTNGGVPNNNTGTSAAGRNSANAGNLIVTTGTGTITFNAGGNGVATNGTAITLTAPIVANGGTVTLATTAAGDQVIVGNTGSVTNTFQSAAAAGQVMLQGDIVRLGSGNSSYTGKVTTTGDVVVQPATTTTMILGNTNNTAGGSPYASQNTATIDNNSILNITANTLVLGGTNVTSLTLKSSTTYNGNDGIDAKYANNLELWAGAGSISQDSITPVFVGGTAAAYNGGLSVVAGGTVSLANFLNEFGSIAIQAGGNVALQGNTTNDNNGTLNIGTVGLTGTGYVVSGISAPGSSVTLINVGSTTQDTTAGAQINASNLILEGAVTGPYATYSNYANPGTTTTYNTGFNGSYTLNNLSNAISNIAGSVSSLSLTDNTALTVAANVSDNLAALTTSSGNVLTSTSFSGITGTGAITLVDNGLLTIANNAPIVTPGGNILIEDQTFTNNDGASALSATGNYWRVYSQDPRNDSDGALDTNSTTYASFVQYAAPNSYGAPGAATTFTNANAVLTGANGYGNGTGNGFLYSVSPTVTESVSNAFTKVYDGNKNYIGAGGASEALNYNAQVIKVSGNQVTNLGAGGVADTVTLNKTASMSLTQTNFYSSPNVGTYPLSTLPGVTVSLASAVDKNSVTIYGYSVSPNVMGSASITPAPLTITASTQSRVYGTTPGTLVFGAGQTVNYTTTPLQNGETIGSVTLTGSTASLDQTTNAGTLTNAITPSAAMGGTFTASNYNINYVQGNVTITQAPLTFTPVAASVQYNATALNNATYSDTLSNYNISGYQNGQNAAGINLALSGSMAFNGATNTTVENAGTYTQGVGSLALTSTNSNYSLNFTNPVPHNYVITQAPVTVIGSKTFDGSATASYTTFTSPVATNSVGTPTGVYAADAGNVTITNSGSATLNSANAGSYSTAVGNATVAGGLTLNTLGITLNGSAAGNYYLAGATYNVTAANVTLAGGTKVYDGNTNVPAGDITSLSGLANGDALGGDLTLTGTGSITNANVGSYTGGASTFSVAGLTLGGSAAANYTLGAGTFTVTAKPLTITASNQSRVYGPTGGTLALGTLQTANFTTTGLVHGTGDSVTSVTLAATALSTAATTGVSTQTNAITPSVAAGSGLTNYSISYVNGNVSITPAPLTVTANSTSKTYGSTVTFAGTEFMTTALVNGETVSSATLASAGAVANASVAGSPYSITVSGATGGGTFNAANYNINYVPGTLTVNQAPAITITANPQSKTYGATANLGTTAFTPSGLVGGDTITGVTLTSAGSPATADVANYNIVPSNETGVNLANYAGVNYVNGTLTVGKAPLTITGTKVYDNTTAFATGQLTLTGGVNGQTVTLTGGTGTSASPNVNTYPGSTLNNIGVSVSGGVGNALLSNYAVPPTGTLTITPAVIAPVATATNASGGKVYDGTTVVPAATITSLSGLATGDALGGDLTITGTGSISSPNVGSYTGAAGTFSVAGLTLGGAAAGNYILGAGTYTVSAKSVTASGSKVYDGTTGAASGTYTLPLTGVLAADSANVGLTGAATLGSANAGSYSTSNTGTSGLTVNSLALNGVAASNYALTAVNYTVTQAPAITITASPQSKTYGTVANLGTTAFTTAGLVGGDTVAGVTLASTGTPATANAGVYSIVPTNETGGTFNPANYTGVNYANGVLTVNQAPLTITGTKVYDNTTGFTVGQLTLTGGVNGQTVTLTGGTGTSASPNVNTYPNSPVAGLAITVSGGAGNALLSNYLVPTTGALTITPATLIADPSPGTGTGAGVGGGKVYDGTTVVPATTITSFSGLASGDALGGDLTITGTGSISSPNVGSYTGAAGTFSVAGLTLGGSAAGNYILGAGTYTVSAKSVTAVGSKVYDGTTGAASGTYTLPLTGVLAADSANVGLTGAATLGNANAGSYSTANAGTSGLTVNSLALNGVAASNYALTAVNYTVTQAPAITITASPQSKTYGTVANLGTTAFTTAGLVGGDTVGGVTLASTGTPATANAGAYSIVPSNETGVNLANYAGVNYVNGVLTVNPAALLVSANPQTKVYGSTDPTLTYTETGLANGDPDPLTGTLTRTPGETVAGGPYAIAQGTLASANGNYTISYTGNNLTITAKPITITGSKSYDGTATAVASTFGGLTSQLVGGDAVTLAGAGTLGSANAGSYSSANSGTAGLPLAGLSLTGGAAGNYALVAANYTVNPEAIVITAVPTTKTYDGTPSSPGTPVVTSGIIYPVDPGTLTQTYGGPNAGTGLTLTPTSTFPNSTNYTVTYVPVMTGVINPAPLTVTGTRLYDGQPDAPGSILTTTGELPGDPALTVTGTGTVATLNVGTTPLVSPGTLTLVGLGSGNYTISGGTVTITPAPLTISAVNTTKVYDGGVSSNGTPVATGLIGTDTISLLTQTYNSRNVLGTNGSTLTVTPGYTIADGNGGGNYAVVVNTSPGTITPESITVIGTPVSKLYDGTPRAPGVPTVINGTIYGPDIGTFTQTYGGPNAGTNLTLTPTGTIADGNGSGNYVVTYVPVTTGTISPLPVILFGTRVYDAATDAAAPILNVTNDLDGSNLTLSGTGALIAPAVGLEPIASFTGLTLGGSAAGNYTFVGAIGNVQVTSAAAIPVIVPLNQTASGVSEVPSDFTIYDGGILYIKPTQNGIVTGTIATIDGQAYQPDNQLGCTLGPSGACVENGLAPSAGKAPAGAR